MASFYCRSGQRTYKRDAFFPLIPYPVEVCNVKFMVKTLDIATRGVLLNRADARRIGVLDGDRVQIINPANGITWGTANYALDAGTYTIYAVSQPYNKDNLGQAAYGTVSIIIKKPFVSATASQSTVAKGDRIYITGTAEGDPAQCPDLDPR